MGRTLMVAAIQLATGLAVALSVALVLTLVAMLVSGKGFVEQLHLVLILVGILSLVCTAASQSPTSGESAASGSLTPAAVFLVVGIASLVIAFTI